MNDPKLNIKQFKQQQGYFAINHTNHYVLADNYVTKHNNVKGGGASSLRSNDRFCTSVIWLLNCRPTDFVIEAILE